MSNPCFHIVATFSRTLRYHYDMIYEYNIEYFWLDRQLALHISHYFRDLLCCQSVKHDNNTENSWPYMSEERTSNAWCSDKVNTELFEWWMLPSNVMTGKQTFIPQHPYIRIQCLTADVRISHQYYTYIASNTTLLAKNIYYVIVPHTTL